MNKKIDYKEGEVGPTGKVITFIYGRSDEVIVYRVEDGSVEYDTIRPKFTDHEQVVLELYRSILSKLFRFHANKTKEDRSERAVYHDELASALFRGWISSDIAAVELVFSKIEERVLRRITSSSRLTYLGSSVVAFLLAVFGLVLLYNKLPTADHSIYLIYLLFGLGGAMSSVLTRFSKLEMNEPERFAITLSSGVARIAIGLLFTIFVIAVSKSGIALSIASNAEWSMAVLSFAAGFSEKLAPEILSEVTTRKTT